MLDLAVCIDDYGLHPGVNEAAIALVRAGRVSVISAMVGAPAWRQGVPALLELRREQVDVGLHLDLTELPLDAAVRRPLWHWIAGAGLLPGMRSRARREIEAQLDAFVAAMGRLPSHVDGHQHVHQLPGVRQELLAALAARDGGQRTWLRDTRAAAQAPWCGGKPWLIAGLGSGGLRRLAGAQRWQQNARLLGVYDFRGDAQHYLALAARWLRAARTGDLWMCHPASASAADDPIAQARLTEYEALRSERFGQLLYEAHARVRPLSALLAR